MTKVRVNPGSCGFTVTIKADKSEGKTVAISLDTECEMLLNMMKEVSSMDMRSLFANHTSNPVYRAAARHLKHSTCPVPSAILKAVEAELGLNIPKDVKIEFLKE